MALSGFKIIDADGHVTEPASLYSTHIDPKFRAAADALLVAGRRRQSRNRSRAVSEVAVGGTAARRSERSRRPGQTAVRPQPSTGFARGRLRSSRAHPRHGQGRYRRRGMLRDGRDFGMRRDRSRDGSRTRARLQPMGRRVLRRVPVANQGGRDRSAARDGSMRRGGRVSCARAVGSRHHDLRQSRRDAARPSVLRPALSKRAGRRPADLFSRRHRPAAVRARPRGCRQQHVHDASDRARLASDARDGGGGRRRTVRALPDAQAGIFRRRNLMGAVVGRADGRTLQALRASHAASDAQAVRAHAQRAMLLHVRSRRDDVARGDAPDRRAAL